MQLDEELIADLKRDEGYRAEVYECTAGKKTIGYGWNIEDRPIRQSEAELRLRNDIVEVMQDIEFRCPWFSDLTPNRKRAIANMVFNLGITRFLGFKKMIAAIEEHDWKLAAAEAVNSRWARQVGGRAKRIADLIRIG